jgi:hypothetical protein
MVFAFFSKELLTIINIILGEQPSNANARRFSFTRQPSIEIQNADELLTSNNGKFAFLSRCINAK